jgi:hypothetical protein
MLFLFNILFFLHCACILVGRIVYLLFNEILILDVQVFLVSVTCSFPGRVWKRILGGSAANVYTWTTFMIKSLRKMIRTFIAIVLLGCASVANAADGRDLNIELDQNILQSGELQSFVETLKTEGAGGKKRVIGVIMIEATQDEVWDVIQDWDAYGEFVPGLKYYKTIQKTVFQEHPAYFQSFVEGYIKIPVPFVRKTYTLDAIFEQEKYFIQWKLVQYDRIQALNKLGLSLTKSSNVVQNIEGFSYLEPFDNGKKTILYYAPVVEINIPVPQSVERFLSGTIMTGFMEAIKNRVENRKKDISVKEE